MSGVSLYLKYCSVAFCTCGGASTRTTFKSNSIFSYQFGPRKLNNPLPFGGTDIFEVNVMKLYEMEDGLRKHSVSP